MHLILHPSVAPQRLFSSEDFGGSMRCEVCFILRHKRHLGVTPQRRRLKIFHLRGASTRREKIRGALNGSAVESGGWSGWWRQSLEPNRMQCLLRLIRSTTHPATGKGNHSDSPELPDLPLSDCGLDESVGKQRSGKSLHVPKQGGAYQQSSSTNLSVIIYRHKDGGIRLWSWCREPSWKDVN